MKVFVFGDSHVLQLRSGYKTLVDANHELVDIEFYARHGLNWTRPKVTQEGPGMRIVCNRAKAQTPTDYVLSDKKALYVFSALFHFAPMLRHPAWKEMCPWQCADANPDLGLVSDAVVSTWIEDQLATRFALAENIKSAGYDIAVVEAPRPLARAPEGYGVRPDVLLAVDNACRRAVLHKLNVMGIPVIHVPDFVHPEGFTTEAYSPKNQDDMHHGGREFGKLMARAIHDFAVNRKQVLTA